MEYDVGSDCPKCESAKYVRGRCYRCGYRVNTSTTPPSLSVGIAKLSLQPGDVVLVKLGGTIPPSEFNFVYESLAKVLPAGVKALVLRSEDELSILRAGQPVAPEVDEAIVCEVKR